MFGCLGENETTIMETNLTVEGTGILSLNLNPLRLNYNFLGNRSTLEGNSSLSQPPKEDLQIPGYNASRSIPPAKSAVSWTQLIWHIIAGGAYGWATSLQSFFLEKSSMLSWWMVSYLPESVQVVLTDFFSVGKVPGGGASLLDFRFLNYMVTLIIWYMLLYLLVMVIALLRLLVKLTTDVTLCFRDLAYLFKEIVHFVLSTAYTTLRRGWFIVSWPFLAIMRVVRKGVPQEPFPLVRKSQQQSWFGVSSSGSSREAESSALVFRNISSVQEPPGLDLTSANDMMCQAWYQKDRLLVLFQINVQKIARTVLGRIKRDWWGNVFYADELGREEALEREDWKEYYFLINLVLI
jgi:hypothetical protein